MSLPAPISLEVAQARLLALADPLGGEVAPVEQSLGRYLGNPITARRSQPPADLSSMDGYAVCADDLFGPWTVIGESAAGHPFAGALKPGQAIRISTGAIMPKGSGAVLLQENAVREGETLHLSGDDPATPRHIRRAGFDFLPGDRLLEEGARIGPAQIALAIASGHGEVQVGRQPRICVIDSGDELASDPAYAKPHQTPASNGPMLAAMAAPHVAHCQRIGPVSDRLDALVHAFEDATGAADADVIVISGGASVGDHDLVRPALEQWGAQIAFWRIAIKPGKPLMVARKGQTIILGLPGNPVSSYVTGFLFMLPLLRHLAGAAEPLPRAIVMPLANDMPATGPRMEFVRGRFSGREVTAFDQTDSSALGTLASANALIIRAAGARAAKSGEAVSIYCLENGGSA